MNRSEDRDAEVSQRRWSERFLALAQRGANSLEDLVDVSWARLSRRLGLRVKQHIVAYRGYGNGNAIWLRGRVLGGAPLAGPLEDDGWFENLQATYQRWESDEIADATVVVTYRGERQSVQTDGEGYYEAKFTHDESAVGLEFAYAELVAAESAVPSYATHQVFSPNRNSQLLLISDMDDTVIHTGITDLLLAAQLTFLNNAKTRKPLPGVGALYRQLAEGPDGTVLNPIFYVSNSAWNMYDLLYDFLELNGIPDGPLMLRDLGLTAPGEGAADHKPDTIREIMSRCPDLPVVLVGDSGQHDAQIYSGIIRDFPERVQAVYIRDVDPKQDSGFDAAVDEVIAAGSAPAVPFLRVKDSAEMARHARELGLLSQAQVDAVVDDVRRDRRRARLEAELERAASEA